MIIENDKSGDYPDGPTVKINLTKFSKDEGDNSVLFYGYNSLFNQKYREKYSNFKKRILLNLWMPTEFTCDPFVSSHTYIPDGLFYDFFTDVYCICPYTAEWLNNKLHTSKFKFIAHPFASPNDYGGDSLDFTKKYDVCYFGGIHGPDHEMMAMELKKYNHRISYISPNRYTTDINLTHHEKMQLAANSKISIVFNQCPLSINHIKTIKKYKDWKENKAFEKLDDNISIIPQYKCRTAEAAFCRSIILVKYDQWNIIEKFFDKDEFIYFDNIKDLNFKINDILQNYDNYNTMLDKAQNKAQMLDGSSILKIICRRENVKL